MSFRFPWRAKVEVDAEIKKLTELQGSEPFRLWTSKIKDSIRADLVKIFQLDIRHKQEILDTATMAKAKYDILCLVPNEQLDLEEEMERIEKEEAKAVQESLRRGTRRVEGTV